MIDQRNIDYKAEIIRKSIHLCSLSIPIIYYFISREQALMLLVPVTMVFLFVDLLRHFHSSTAKIFYRTFGWLLRTHEHDGGSKRLNGATHVLISATLCVLIFPKLITITAFAVLIISDSAAALVGRRFGSKKFLNKSVEGSAAFFMSALVVIAATPKISAGAGEYCIAIVAAAMGRWWKRCRSASTTICRSQFPLALLCGYCTTCFIPHSIFMRSTWQVCKWQ